MQTLITNISIFDLSSAHVKIISFCWVNLPDVLLILVPCLKGEPGWGGAELAPGQVLWTLVMETPPLATLCFRRRSARSGEKDGQPAACWRRTPMGWRRRRLLARIRPFFKAFVCAAFGAMQLSDRWLFSCCGRADLKARLRPQRLCWSQCGASSPERVLQR